MRTNRRTRETKVKTMTSRNNKGVKEGKETDGNKQNQEGKLEDEDMVDAEGEEKRHGRNDEDDEPTGKENENNGSVYEGEEEVDDRSVGSNNNISIYNIDERSVRLVEVAWHSLLPNVRDKAERFVMTKPRKGAKKYQCLATMMGKVEKIIEQSEAYEDTDLTLDEWRELIKNSVKENGAMTGKVTIKNRNSARINSHKLHNEQQTYAKMTVAK